MEETTKRLAQLVATGVDICWKEAPAPTAALTITLLPPGEHAPAIAELRNHFCTSYLPLALNSQFVEAGVKEAKSAGVSTTGRNEELRSIYAICRSFLFGQLNSMTKNTPARVRPMSNDLCSMPPYPIPCAPCLGRYIT
jgi:hypothetical protein